MPKTKAAEKNIEKKPKDVTEEAEKIIEIDDEAVVDEEEVVEDEELIDAEDEEAVLDEEDVDPFKDKWEE